MKAMGCYVNHVIISIISHHAKEWRVFFDKVKHDSSSRSHHYWFGLINHSPFLLWHEPLLIHCFVEPRLGPTQMQLVELQTLAKRTAKQPVPVVGSVRWWYHPAVHSVHSHFLSGKHQSCGSPIVQEWCAPRNGSFPINDAYYWMVSSGLPSFMDKPR